MEALQVMGIEAGGTTCDVTGLADVEALADFAWREFGQVDVIVNNAGIGSALKPAMEMTREDVLKALEEQSYLQPINKTEIQRLHWSDRPNRIQSR